MFLNYLTSNKRKAISIITFFIFAVLFIVFAYDLKFSSASINCCHHECNLTDPKKCIDNKVYECQANCDTDIYQDWCEIQDCSATSQTCVKGVCVTESSTCFDGTSYNVCSTNTGAPWYCDNSGNLVENCQVCGCSGSWICGPNNTFCCDNQCNGSCSPSGCTVAYDPDCGADGCCGDGICDIGEDNISCPVDCSSNSCGSLKYFGHSFTAIEGIGSGNYIDEVKDYSNVVMVGCDSTKHNITTCAVNDAAKIQQASAFNIKSLLVVNYVFFNATFNPDGSLNTIELYPDYKQRWNDYADQIAPYIDDALGFFILDEPYWIAIQINMSFSEMKNMLESCASTVKSRFPNTKIVGTIAITEDDLKQETILGYKIPDNALTEYGIPDNYDWVGFDYYYKHVFEPTMSEYFSIFTNVYMKNLKKYKKPDQKIVIIPQAFYHKSKPVTEEELNTLADFYYFTSQTEPDVVAMITFLYPSISTTENLVGVRDLIQVKNKYKQIGSEIINQQCSDVCVPDGCNGNCPVNCTVSDDPDCGTTGCCGDRTTNSTNNEICDVADGNFVNMDLNGKTCALLGYSGGDLACRFDCQNYDPSSCVGAPPACGNNICDAGENCLNCPTECCPKDCSDTCFSLGFECGTQTLCGVSTDCGSCILPEVCNTNGQCIVPNCTENWTCTSWSACASGIQSRTCTDSNSCGTINNKPDEIQSCLSVAIIDPNDGFKIARDGSPINFNIISLGGTEPYIYEWKNNGIVFGDNNQWQNLDPSTMSISNHTISVQATDANSSVADDSITIEILPAGTLTAQIQMWQTEFARDPSLPAMFGVDAQGGTAPYTFVWNSDIEGDFSTEQWPSIDVSSWVLGTHHITVTVTDANSNTVTDTIDVKIVEMSADIKMPLNGGHFYAGDDIGFSANVSGGTPPYTYQWSSDKDGSLASNGPENEQWDSFLTNSLSKGVHSITLTVIDSSTSPITVSKQIQIQVDPIDPSQVKCFNFSDCDDNDPCTEDVCLNPGLMSASCSNNPKTICQDNDNCCPGGCNNTNDNDCTATVDNDDPAKVLVVYNDKCARDDNKNGIKDYYELALYYQQKRNIPAENMLPVYPSVGSGGCAYYYYQVDKYPDFYNDIVKVIQNKLTQIGENNIYYLLLVGLPTRIYVDTTSNTTRSLDQSLITLNAIGSANNYYTYWDYCSAQEYCEKYWDSTLSKSRFNHSFKYGADNMYLVTRIQNKDVIDRALYGEKYIYNEDGYYRGLGYVDTRYGEYDDNYLNNNYPSFSDSSSYARGDRKMAYGKRIFEMKNWSYKWEATGKEIGESGAIFTDSANAETAPDAMWYEGWYNYGTYHDVWNWKAGAVACDLNSNSAQMTSTSFLRDAFNNGLTAGVGVTGEPYLTGHPQPEVFIYYMLNGYNFAEASNLSYPGFKWRDIAYGDPLYNPNKKDKIKVKDIVLPLLRQVFVETYLSNSSSAVDITAQLDLNTINPEVASFKIEYGFDSNYGNTVDYDEIYATKKKFSLNGLTPGTNYHYKITAKDPVGNIVSSFDKTFKTAPDDSVIPPSLSASASSQVGTASLSVDFSFSAGEPPISYEWNFADGQTSTEQNPTHTFNNKGFYPVILSAKFANGLTRVAKLLIITK